MRVWKVINDDVASSNFNLILHDCQYCIVVNVPVGLTNQGKVKDLRILKSTSLLCPILNSSSSFLLVSLIKLLCVCVARWFEWEILLMTIKLKSDFYRVHRTGKML